MKPDEIFAFFNNPQGSKFLEWLDSKTPVTYSGSPDGVKAAMDMANLVGRKSLVDEIKQQIKKGSEVK